MEAIVVDLLGTQELQRLKRISQLGLAHQVFPGAEHSRFAHSLGAAFIAIKFGRHISRVAQRQFASALVPDESVIRDIGVAALCHDLGHGPLSHAFEREIVQMKEGGEEWAKKLGVQVGENERKSIKWHELVSRGLIAWEDGALHARLESQEEGSTDRIVSLLRGEYFIPYLPRILASDVDVDRLDFIRRDTLQTGVQYGRYDIDWIISTCTIGRFDERPGYPYVIGFDEKKGFRAVEQFLIARQAMYETVYQHKTVQCAEGMVALFLKRLRVVVIEKGWESNGSGFANTVTRIIGGEVLEASELIGMDDYGLMHFIDYIARDGKSVDVILWDLARRIVFRDLLKRVPIDSDRLRDFWNNDGKNKMKHLLGQYCDGNDPEYYILHSDRDFNLMESDILKRSFFVSNGMAREIATHDSFVIHSTRNAGKKTCNIFCVKEALEDITKLIQNDR